MAKELRSKFDLSVTAYDEMFMTEDQRAENQLPKIHKIPIAQISDFPDHPYRVLDDEDMNILKESMLNQASTDRVQLAELMGISDTQLSHITNVEAGCGLMKVGSALVPFINKFPHDTKLYRLMTTKPGETV